MEVKTVPDPTIEEPTDMIIRITATAICGSDLYLYHNGKPVMEEDYVVGHEPMGIVEEVGSVVTKVKKRRPSCYSIQHWLWRLSFLCSPYGKSM